MDIDRLIYLVHNKEPFFDKVKITKIKDTNKEYKEDILQSIAEELDCEGKVCVRNDIKGIP